MAMGVKSQKLTIHNPLPNILINYNIYIYMTSHAFPGAQQFGSSLLWIGPSRLVPPQVLCLPRPAIAVPTAPHRASQDP